MNPPFSIKESLLFGWKALQAHYRVFLPVIFIFVAISFIIQYISDGKDPFNVLVAVSMVLGVFVDILISLGLTKIALKITAGEAIAFDDVFSTTHLLFSYIGASLLYLLIVFGGLLLLIVPGFVWLVSYWLFPYALIDKEDGALAALSEAKRISQGARWYLFLFILVSIILNISGIVIFFGTPLFFIGPFFMIPITTVAAAHIYRALQKRAEQEPVEQYTLKNIAEEKLQPLPPKPSPVHQENN